MINNGNKTAYGNLEKYSRETNFNITRSRNVLIFKVKERLDAEENVYTIIKDIFNQVGLEINDLCIETAYRLGKPSGCRPILVRFIASRWKSLLFKKIKEFSDLGLAISNDLTREERLERKELVFCKNKLLKEGIQDVKIRANKLLVGGESLFLKDLQLMEKDEREMEVSIHSSSQSKSVSTPPAKRGCLGGSKRQLSCERKNMSLEKFVLKPSSLRKPKQDE